MATKPLNQKVLDHLMVVQLLSALSFAMAKGIEELPKQLQMNTILSPLIDLGPFNHGFVKHQRRAYHSLYAFLASYAQTVIKCVLETNHQLYPLSSENKKQALYQVADIFQKCEMSEIIFQTGEELMSKYGCSIDRFQLFKLALRVGVATLAMKQGLDPAVMLVSEKDIFGPATKTEKFENSFSMLMLFEAL